MKKKLTTGAVIVAAGMSTRMKDFKQMMEIGGITIADRVIANFQKAGIRDIVMVTGYRAAELEKHLARRGITFLRNDNYAHSEMFDSAKIGLSYLQDSVDRVFFCPVDVPFFSADTVRSLLDACVPGTILIPSQSGRSGHPVLIDAALLPAILSYRGAGGLKGAFDTLPQQIVYVEIEEEGAFLDADTREDFDRLVELHNRTLMRPEVRLTLSGTQSFFGAGTLTLLRQIDRLGNVREACEKTGISYSKGWKILRELEKGFGDKMVERTQGGKSGGSARLTGHCREWMQLYDDLEQDVSAYAAKRFEEMLVSRKRLGGTG